MSVEFLLRIGGKDFSEALEVIHMIWNENNESDSSFTDFEGKYYRLKKMSIDPETISTTSSSHHDSKLGLRTRVKEGSKVDGDRLDGLCL